MVEMGSGARSCRCDRPAAQAEPGIHRLVEPAAFWDIVLGSGYRVTVDQLGPDRAERVRESVIGQPSAHDPHPCGLRRRNPAR
ncbi:hypothetical protein LWC33_29040 [Pseudonocardia sp. RS11V-5]|uniref:hypothetical protein n=1 Tax=Pseudonocardia terrae TaxID=2905831 RepID=UPI001E41E38B|nr:hypothetical protein [Pseudonocardia terrae]MCE3555480.1 hypothetical protein [Pseudonocardia terrae]